MALHTRHALGLPSPLKHHPVLLRAGPEHLEWPGHKAQRRPLEPSLLLAGWHRASRLASSLQLANHSGFAPLGLPHSILVQKRELQLGQGKWELEGILRRKLQLRLASCISCDSFLEVLEHVVCK